MDISDVLEQLKILPKKKESGEVYITSLHPLIKDIGIDNDLAIKLWDSGDRNAREIAVRICDGVRIDEALLDRWVLALDEWGLTDSFTGHLVRHTPFAVAKAYEWAQREDIYEKRAGFALIAQMAWCKNSFTDNVFIEFLPFISSSATDTRLHVKKAVNWALRDIGKRNQALQRHAVDVAMNLRQSQDKISRWVGTHRCHEFM